MLSIILQNMIYNLQFVIVMIVILVNAMTLEQSMQEYFC